MCVFVCEKRVSVYVCVFLVSVSVCVLWVFVSKSVSACVSAPLTSHTHSEIAALSAKVAVWEEGLRVTALQKLTPGRRAAAKAALADDAAGWAQELDDVSEQLQELVSTFPGGQPPNKKVPALA